MDQILPLSKMTTAEKLDVMDRLWADLSLRADSFESPAWHEAVLREREARVEEGKESFLDWEETKRRLRERLQ